MELGGGLEEGEKEEEEEEEEEEEKEEEEEGRKRRVKGRNRLGGIVGMAEVRNQVQPEES